jgi:MoaA/NifB/PqqE/SkfB family radical SAM enzyme
MGFMNWDLYTKIIDDYSHLMSRYSFKGRLGYCQMAEPFIMKDISKWVQYATDRGIEVYFNTNASRLFPEIVDSLLKIGFSGIFNISFHGMTKQIYEKIMGLDFDKTIDNIDYLLSKYPSSRVTINAVPYAWPPGEKRKLLEYWKERGVDVIFTKALSRSGLALNIRGNQRKRIAGCRTERIFYEMVIAFNGDVLLCCHDMAREVIVGNLNYSNIEEVWNGETFLSTINMIYFERNLPSGFICKRCEESEAYWSPARIIKRLLPKKVINELRKRQKPQWIITRTGNAETEMTRTDEKTC